MDSITYFCALFDKSKPIAVGIKTTDATVIQPLFLPGRSIYSIDKSVSKYRQWFERSFINNKTIVTNDFKSVLSGFKLALPKEKLRVFDVFMPVPKTPKTFEEAEVVINETFAVMQKKKLCRWQHIAANASVVYESLERRGILVGLLQQYPKWSHRTISGRSKNQGFNLQGTTSADCISDPMGSRQDIFVNFDWRAADIRIAAILSGDKLLEKLSIESDPYLKLSQEIGGTRNECKTKLLSAINAMYIQNTILDIFPTMQKWMLECKEKLDDGQAVTSILGRKFFGSDKPRSAFNATMQGSIAHAMQLTIRRIWELDIRLLAETHDSITIACNRNSLEYVIKTISGIMCRPFSGVLESNPTFQVRVNIGKEWCKWKPFRLYSDIDKYQKIS